MPQLCLETNRATHIQSQPFELERSMCAGPVVNEYPQCELEGPIELSSTQPCRDDLLVTARDMVTNVIRMNREKSERSALRRVNLSPRYSMSRV